LRLGLALFTGTIALLGAMLSFYFGLRLKHTNALLFSLLCLIMPMFTSYSLLHSAFALPIFPWYGFEILAGYLLALLVIYLHNRICGVGLLASRISTGVAVAFCALALCYGLSGAYLTVPVMKLFSALAFLFKAGTALYLLITAILARRDNTPQAEPLYYASIFYAVTVVWDRLLPEYEPAVSGWYSEWGSVILVIAIGYTLWRGMVTAHRNSLAFASENRQMVRQLSMQTEYAKQLQARSEENRRLIHDFRQHIRTVGGMVTQALNTADNQKILHELEAYLAQLPDSLTVTGVYSAGIFCGNVAADSLLQYYDTIAKQDGIATNFELRLPQALPLTDVELCTVLGNLLENAVDACHRQTEDPRNIHIASQIDSELVILIENSYDGVLKQHGKRFLSRKNDGAEHGIGIESARYILEHHGGSLHIYLQEKKFQAGIVLPLD
ncbi:MAG: GHKL domain-containing protein, partial [Eubacterium sp.]